jgi:hypothetical protein
MAITHADRKTDNIIPPIDEHIPDAEEVKKPVTNNAKTDVELEKSDKPLDLWESFLERRNVKKTPVQVGTGSGDARFGNVHETGMEQDPVDDDFCLCVNEGNKQTYIGKPDKESKDNDKQ